VMRISHDFPTWTGLGTVTGERDRSRFYQFIGGYKYL
jgi:hypothetical protein